MKLHFIVPRQSAEKSPKGALPLDPGDGPSLPNLQRGPLPPGPSSHFPQRQVCYDMDVILRRISAPTQYNEAQFDFLFLPDKFALSLPISDKVSYVPGQTNCFYSDAVLP